jgi:hypothetical protein
MLTLLQELLIPLSLIVVPGGDIVFVNPATIHDCDPVGCRSMMDDHCMIADTREAGNGAEWAGHFAASPNDPVGDMCVGQCKNRSETFFITCRPLPSPLPDPDPPIVASQPSVWCTPFELCVAACMVNTCQVFDCDTEPGRFAAQGECENSCRKNGVICPDGITDGPDPMGA